MDKGENIKNDIVFADNCILQKCGKDAILNNKYYIDRSKKIESLSTNDYDVFEVKNISGEKKDQNLCVRILKDPTLLRYEAIKKIISNPIDNFICPIDFGIIVFENTDEEFIGIIYPKIFGVTLGELIDKKETFSEKYIIKNVISNINEILRKLHDLDIDHGSINLDTIRLTKDSNVVLDECFLFLDIKTSPIYYPPACSVVNISSSFGDPQSDYYALGVVCLELLIGERVSNYKVDKLNAERIYKSSHDYFLKNRIITGTIKKIIQGLLQDNKDDMFGYKELFDPPNLNSIKFSEKKKDFDIPIIFCGKEIYFLKEFAYEMSSNHKASKELIISGRLKEHIKRNCKDKKIVNSINFIIDNRKDFDINNSGKYEIDKEFSIANIVQILSSQSFMVVENLVVCFKKYYITNLILTLIKEERNADILLLERVINCFSFFMSNQNMIEYEFIKIYKDVCKKRNGDFIPKVIETIYRLHPSFQCIYKFNKSKIVLSLKDIILAFEKSKINDKSFFSNAYLLPFLCSRLEDYDWESESSRYNTKFLLYYDSRVICFLSIFAYLQEKYKIHKLRYLFELFFEKINLILPRLVSNKYVKEEIENNIKKIDGNLFELKNNVLNQDVINKDASDLDEVISKVRKIKIKMQSIFFDLEKKEMFKEKAMNFTLAISYVMFFFVIIYNLIVYWDIF